MKGLLLVGLIRFKEVSEEKEETRDRMRHRDKSSINKLKVLIIKAAELESMGSFPPAPR